MAGCAGLRDERAAAHEVHDRQPRAHVGEAAARNVKLAGDVARSMEPGAMVPRNSVVSTDPAHPSHD